MRYTIIPVRHAYDFVTQNVEPLDHVWNCEKCWFGPGEEAIIVDENGNMKMFRKEKEAMNVKLSMLKIGDLKE